MAEDKAPETIENGKLTLRNASKTELRHAAMLSLEEKGFSHGAIAQVTGLHKVTVSKALPNLRKKSLTSPDMVKLARKTVKSVMAGFVGEDVKLPDGSSETKYDVRVKASDALRAAEIVADRAEPKTPEGGTGGQALTFVQINHQYFDKA